jgi:cation transport regulator
MPYQKNNDLPETVKDNLPKPAQDIYKAAFNNAWEEYENPTKRHNNQSREETSHAVAWSAVKTKYQKNEKGEWVEREEDTSP